MKHSSDEIYEIFFELRIVGSWKASSQEFHLFYDLSSQIFLIVNAELRFSEIVIESLKHDDLRL